MISVYGFAIIWKVKITKMMENNMEPKKPKKKTGLIIAALLLLLVGAGGGLWYYLGKGSAGDAVYIMPVSACAEFGTGAANRFSGVVEAEQTVDYKLDSSKTLLETLVEEGDIVHVGDVLFRYDTDSIKLDISQKKLDIQGLRAQITSNNERIAATTDDLEKMSLRNENQQTEYRIKAAQNELNALEASLEKAEVVCTVDGTVKSVGDTMSGSDVYISVMKTGDYVVKGKINEMNISQMPQGTKVVIRSRVDNTVWDGFVSRVDTSQTAGQENENYFGPDNGNQSSKYYFFVELSNSKGLFLGQHVIIEPVDGSGKTGLWLYEGYVGDAGSGNAYVWADDNGKLKKQPVKLGEYDEEIGSWEILEGLSINDYIAFPDETLREGMKTTTEYVYHEPEEGMYEENMDFGMMGEEDYGESFEEELNEPLEEEAEGELG